MYKRFRDNSIAKFVGKGLAHHSSVVLVILMRRFAWASYAISRRNEQHGWWQLLYDDSGGDISCTWYDQLKAGIALSYPVYFRRKENFLKQVCFYFNVMSFCVLIHLPLYCARICFLPAVWNDQSVHLSWDVSLHDFKMYGSLMERRVIIWKLVATSSLHVF